MKIVVVHKVQFTVTTYTNVVSITYNNGTITINNGTNHTYSSNDVKIMFV